MQMTIVAHYAIGFILGAATVAMYVKLKEWS